MSEHPAPELMCAEVALALTRIATIRTTAVRTVELRLSQCRPPSMVPGNRRTHGAARRRDRGRLSDRSCSKASVGFISQRTSGSNHHDEPVCDRSRLAVNRIRHNRHAESNAAGAIGSICQAAPRRWAARGREHRRALTAKRTQKVRLHACDRRTCEAMLTTPMPHACRAAWGGWRCTAAGAPSVVQRERNST